jgi:Holliday junction DNA helicase RuvA
VIVLLTGRVVAKSAASCVLDVGGVGYALAMSSGSLASLPAVGDETSIHTHLHVREDELSLFGFAQIEEKSVFLKLITVSGVGPKVALAALSSFAPAAIGEAIAREDAGLLGTIPGVGKKTAQRIIVELKDTFGAEGIGPSGVSAPPGSAASEARDALLSMGFSAAEVAVAMKGYSGADEAQALLRHALRRLGGAA